MPDHGTTGGVFEDRKDAGTGEQGRVRLWLMALDLADREEASWRKMAQLAVDRFRADSDSDSDNSDGRRRKGARFNILRANTETMIPSLYNSPPIPDVRRTNNDDDPVGKIAAQMLDRSLRSAADITDLSETINAVVFDSMLPGRGVARVRYEPRLDDKGAVVEQLVRAEQVDWRDFRRGPGRRWSEVPWIAFRHRLTREDLIEKFPGVGSKLNLDWQPSITGMDKAEIHDVFKRAEVWEIWDKVKREIIFIAKSHKAKPLKVEQDILKLEGFWPIPPPLYHVFDPNSLIPLVPYELYRDQAEELDLYTSRIRNLIRVLKWRGVRDASIPEFDDVKDAEDGVLVASEGAHAWAAAGGLEKAIWLWPIDKLITVLRELLVQRDQVKQVIFELTGVADIMRGASNPNETLGAQQIKAQFGTLRLSPRQNEIQRFARDLMRIQAEIMSEHFTPEMLMMTSNMPLPTTEQAQIAAQSGQQIDGPTIDQVMELLTSDILRAFRVDIETDSTIQADLGFMQQNMARFVEGLGSFMGAIGPAVESGAIPQDVAVDLLTGFARSFKLGKQAEDALDRLGQQAEQKRNAPQQEQGPSEAEIAAQAEQQKAQLDQQKATADAGLKTQQATAQTEAQAKKMADEFAMKREAATAEHGLKREMANRDMDIKREQMQHGLSLDREKHDALPESQALKSNNQKTEEALRLAQEANFAAAEALRQILALQQTEAAPKSVEIIRDGGKIVGGTITQGDRRTEVTIN